MLGFFLAKKKMKTGLKHIGNTQNSPWATKINFNSHQLSKRSPYVDDSQKTKRNKTKQEIHTSNLLIHNVSINYAINKRRINNNTKNNVNLTFKLKKNTIYANTSTQGTKTPTMMVMMIRNDLEF